MIVYATNLSAVLTAVILLAAPPVMAGSIQLPGAIGTHEIRVDSMQSMRFRNVVRQQYDFSCGSAVVATLLTYHYGRETTEVEAFRRMYELGDQEIIRKEGFSMLDMKHFLADLGYASDGFHLSLSLLAELRVPAIALVEINGYRHFVVIKGMRDGHLLVGDPALGMARYSKAEFEAIRTNDILFLVRDRMDQARESFNADEAWAVIVAPSYELALIRQGLADFTLALPRPADW